MGGWEGTPVWGREKGGYLGSAEIPAGVETGQSEMLWGHPASSCLAMLLCMWVQLSDDLSKSGASAMELSGLTRAEACGVSFLLFWVTTATQEMSSDVMTFFPI